MKLLPITRERYLSGMKRRVLLRASWTQQFTPFSESRKATDSCVIASGTLRSGTHMLQSIVRSLGKWEHIGVYVSLASWDNQEGEGEQGVSPACAQKYAIKKLRNGQVVGAHLYWSKAIEKAVKQVTPQRRTKLLFMYRDPRDSIISRLRENAYPEKYPNSYDPSSSYMFLRDDFTDDDKRLTWLLEESPTIRSYWDYVGWLHSPHCLALKFEDLYAELLGLRDNVIGGVMTRLFNYLEVDPASINPVELFNDAFGTGHTAATDEDKVQRFRKFFKDEHYKIIDNSEYRGVLQAFGYEW